MNHECITESFLGLEQPGYLLGAGGLEIICSVILWFRYIYDLGVGRNVNHHQHDDDGNNEYEPGNALIHLFFKRWVSCLT